MNDDLLDPLKNLQRAEPSPFLFTRLEARLANLAEQRLEVRVSPAAVRLALAGVVGLVLLNVLAWSRPAEPADGLPAAYEVSTADYRLY